MPGRNSRYRSLISSSLKAARLFSPCTFAALANWSPFCRSVHRLVLEEAVRNRRARRHIHGEDTVREVERHDVGPASDEVELVQG
jgi:hypothetical protein